MHISCEVDLILWHIDLFFFQIKPLFELNSWTGKFSYIFRIIHYFEIKTNHPNQIHPVLRPSQASHPKSSKSSKIKPMLSQYPSDTRSTQNQPKLSPCHPNDVSRHLRSRSSHPKSSPRHPMSSQVKSKYQPVKHSHRSMSYLAAIQNALYLKN